jgi:hypothetical protein
VKAGDAYHSKWLPAKKPLLCPSPPTALIEYSPSQTRFADSLYQYCIMFLLRTSFCNHKRLFKRFKQGIIQYRHSSKGNRADIVTVHNLPVYTCDKVKIFTWNNAYTCAENVHFFKMCGPFYVQGPSHQIRCA